jgi:hypothetical protein
MRTVGLIVGSVLIGFPVAFIGTFLLTPVYWRLEPILGMELAGHSGPADWIFELNLLVITALVYLVLRLAVRGFGSKSSETDPAPSEKSGPGRPE